MSPPVGVVVFPGSNCEHDVAEALFEAGAEPRLVWHEDPGPFELAGLVLPGGFAHGDYLRPGAIARFSPAMGAVADAAGRGTPVLGICNGFQVLTEAGLLPGALRRNDGLRFICEMVEVVVEQSTSALTQGLSAGAVLRLPINHYEGNFTASTSVLDELEAAGQVVLRYVANPNGSARAIAGLANRAGNVVGLMPHPERATGELLGSSDGRLLLAAFVGRAAAGLRAPSGAPA